MLFFPQIKCNLKQCLTLASAQTGIDAFMTDEALKALNVSQVDLFYLYTITKTHTCYYTEYLHMQTLPTINYLLATTGTESTTVLHSILDGQEKIQNSFQIQYSVGYVIAAASHSHRRKCCSTQEKHLIMNLMCKHSFQEWSASHSKTQAYLDRSI